MIGRLPGPQKSPITDGLLFPYCMFSRYLVTQITEEPLHVI